MKTFVATLLATAALAWDQRFHGKGGEINLDLSVGGYDFGNSKLGKSTRLGGGIGGLGGIHDLEFDMRKSNGIIGPQLERGIGPIRGLDHQDKRSGDLGRFGDVSIDKRVGGRKDLGGLRGQSGLGDINRHPGRDLGGLRQINDFGSLYDNKGYGYGGYGYGHGNALERGIGGIRGLDHQDKRTGDLGRIGDISLDKQVGGRKDLGGLRGQPGLKDINRHPGRDLGVQREIKDFGSLYDRKGYGYGNSLERGIGGIRGLDHQDKRTGDLGRIGDISIDKRVGGRKDLRGIRGQPGLKDINRHPGRDLGGHREIRDFGSLYDNKGYGYGGYGYGGLERGIRGQRGLYDNKGYGYDGYGYGGYGLGGVGLGKGYGGYNAGLSLNGINGLGLGKQGLGLGGHGLGLGGHGLGLGVPSYNPNINLDYKLGLGNSGIGGYNLGVGNLGVGNLGLGDLGIKDVSGYSLGW